MYFTFNNPGDTLDGIWDGVEEGNFGPNGRIITEDGLKLFKLITVLKDLADEKKNPPKKGQHVRIRYLGERKGKDETKQPYKAFSMRVDD